MSLLYLSRLGNLTGWPGCCNGDERVACVTASKRTTLRQTAFRHRLLWVQESIEKGGEEHTGYSYEGAKTDAYDKVFLADWYLLPDKVLKPVMEYYGAVHTFNLLSGDFSTPTPVPIIQTKEVMERAKKRADGLVKLLDKYVPAP